MKSSLILGALLSVATPALAAATACNADNCYRAILGTVRGQSATHMADCSSFAANTVIAAPVTTTVTQTITPSNAVVNATFTPSKVFVNETTSLVAATAVQTVTPAPVIVTATVTPTPATTTLTVSRFPTFAKRKAPCKRATLPASIATANATASPATTLSPTATPTTAAAAGSKTIPAYASACSGTSRYLSACSCGGASVVTTTAPGSTVIVTATTTLGQKTLTSSVTLAPETSTVTVTLPQTTDTVTVTLTPATSTAATTLAQATATTTVEPAAPALCGNAGLQWAYYFDSQFVDSNARDSWDNFDPTVVKTKAPSASGATTNVGMDNEGGSPAQIYGSGPVLSGVTYVLNHRGYVYAPESGTYTFAIGRVDDIVETWIGPQAFSGWTKDNAKSKVYFITPGRQGTITMRLDAGQYYPLRIIFKQGPGAATFTYSLTSPSGRQLLSSNSPYVVQYSCDATSAPRYPAFGTET